MRMSTQKFAVVCGVVVLGAVIGCGGTGGNGFSSSTSTSGTYDTNNSRPGGANAPGSPIAGAPASAMPGNEILYAEFGGDGTTVERLSADGKHAAALTRLPGGQPVYAQDPSATHVAFVQQKDSGLGLFVNTSTSPDNAVALGPTNFTSFGTVQFAPSGDDVLYTAESATAPAAVYFASTSGKLVKKLDDGDDASIASNGKWVAYSKTVSGHSSIFVIGIDGKGSRQVTHSKGQDLVPQWSKDGSQVLFTSDRDGSFGVYSVSPKTGAVVKLVTGDGVAYGGTTSPDGKRIAFSRIGKPEETGLFVANANGTQVRKVSDTPAATGITYWTTAAAGPGKSSAHAGAPALSVSPRAKSLLKLPDAPPVKKAEPKKEEKAADKAAVESKQAATAKG